jgi:hypothetical protein
MSKWIVLLAVLVGIVAGYAKGHHDASQAGAVALAKQASNTASEAAKRAQLALEFSETARATEARRAALVAEAAADYEKGKADGQAISARTVDDLRRGNLRLRAQWRCEAVPAGSAVHVSAPSGAAGQPDAEAELRIQDSGDLVRIGHQCDAEVRGLQEALRAQQQ